jgi:glucose/arabinose dehydrogenase
MLGIRLNQTLAGLAMAALLSPAEAQDYQIETLASGLDKPWSIAEIGEGDYLVTEKTGRLLRLSDSGEIRTISGTPAVYYANQGGLLEVSLHPDFAENALVYLSLAGGDAAQNRTTIVRGVLSGDTLEETETILEVSPDKATAAHYGGRLAWLPDGTLLVSVGDGFVHREEAQNLDKEFGKLLRIHADGSPPADNPFPDRAPRVFSYGHRNPQGLLYDAVSNRILMHEHGPKGGDELNHIQAGKNYGWPAITYGVDYSGAVISPFTEAPGMEQPLRYWVPSIGPSGLALYAGDDFPDWEGDVLLGSLIDRQVRRLELEAGQVISDSPVFPEVSGRVRDIRVLKDGAIVVVTDEGEVFRISRPS